MEPYKVTIIPSSMRTRVLVTHGPDDLMRAILPPPSALYHEQAPTTFLQGLALWMDRRLHVVLSVDRRDASFCLGLTDELGMAMPQLFYDVEVVDRRVRRRRGRRIQGVGDFAELRRLALRGGAFR
jgi:hypothetical protein